MRMNSLFFGLIPVLFLVGAYSTQAASLYIDPAFKNISRGDSITLSVRLDTDEAAEECINAVDAVISYSPEISPVDISIGDSIFSMWVEQPTIHPENHTITFAGGIPNGYCGRIPGDPRLTNTLVKLIFRSPGFSIGSASGSTTVKIEFAPQTTAYLNDGFGTKADLAMYGTSIDLSSKPGAKIEDSWREAVITDEIPPEEFGITLERIPSETGDYHIIFNTTDKQTGIDGYQVMEEPMSKIAAFDWGRADAPWIDTHTPHSPYRLKDQSLNSIIRVKAIDKAGNEYIATLIPNEDMRTISTGDFIVWGGVGLMGLLFLAMLITAFRTLWRRKKNRQTEAADENEDTQVKDNKHE